MKLRPALTLLLPALVLAAAASSRLVPVQGAATDEAADSPAPAQAKWSPAAAASYLDARQSWWQTWPTAQVDHGTVCISCHTGIPYALARPLLREQAHQAEPVAPEAALYRNVETRVSRWSEMTPFYSDANEGPGKTAQSHSTEAVVNATVLAAGDNRLGVRRAVTRAALDQVWALQLTAGPEAGGWIWQDFHLAPWEASESSYQGAAMLTVQLAQAPGGFSTAADAPHLAMLKSYLQQHYDAQPVLNQIYVLWAADHTPGLLTAAQQNALRSEVLKLQQPDGGWRLASLAPRERLDKTPQPAESDAYATALVILALGSAASHAGDPALVRGVAWLGTHQQPDGRWSASSLNKQRDPESNIGRFMSDAATGYAVLALEAAGNGAGHQASLRAGLR